MGGQTTAVRGRGKSLCEVKTMEDRPLGEESQEFAVPGVKNPEKKPRQTPTKLQPTRPFKDNYIVDAGNIDRFPCLCQVERTRGSDVAIVQLPVSCYLSSILNIRLPNHESCLESS